MPPTVLDILTEQCGYTFVTPEDFRGNMTEARLELTDGQTRYAAAEDLPALQEMLTGASYNGGAAACGFGARLTVTFDDGRTVSVLKGRGQLPQLHVRLLVLRHGDGPAGPAVLADLRLPGGTLNEKSGLSCGTARLQCVLMRG